MQPRPPDCQLEIISRVESLEYESTLFVGSCLLLHCLFDKYSV